MPEERIGKVIHFWPRVGAAQIELFEHALHVGDRVRIRGHGSDFVQAVESLEIEHVAKSEGWPGEHVALEVHQAVHDGDEVFLLKDKR